MIQNDRRPLPHDFHPPVPSFPVTSDDIEDGGTLPEAQLATVGNTSPHLRWGGFPDETRSFAVTCFDPDAPTGSGFWHWVLFDIPVSVTELPTGAGGGSFPGLPDEVIHVPNDMGTRDFLGAGPPPGDGPHRYVFTVYAVDTEKLGPSAEASAALVGFNLRFHTLARAQLVAEYENKSA